MTTVTAVVAVHNSEGTLAELVAAVDTVLAGCCEGHQVVLVDDASTDGSWAQIEALARAHPAVTGIHLARNFGGHNAQLCGIRAATGQVVVTLDDDLQHPPSEIPALLAALHPGVDLVYGVPARSARGGSRSVLSWAARGTVKHLVGAPRAAEATSFRAFRTSLCDAFADFDGPLFTIDALLEWSTDRVDAVSVRHDPRRSGRSGYSTSRLLSHTTTAVLASATDPLRPLTYLGGLLGLGALAAGVAALGALAGTPGQPLALAVLALALLVSAAVLVALGVLGSYAARLHLLAMRRPAYVTDLCTDDPADGAG